MKTLTKAALALGGLAGGFAGVQALRRSLSGEPRYEPRERKPYREFEKKVLVVGGGFAGYTAAKEICRLVKNRDDDIGVMVVSKENYFTFWPMLAGIISSDIEARNVAQPLRRALIHAGASFRRAELESVDLEGKTVRAGGADIPFDHLVLALGASPSYFGIPGVEEHCISITGLGAGEEIRNRVIERYEETTLARGEVSASKLTFVVIGGGATGVETVSELHALIHDTLAGDYPNIDSKKSVRLVLVDANPEILKELDPALRRVAAKKLAQLGIEVVNNVRAKEVREDRVVLDDGREIEAENVVWTAGTRASEKLDELSFAHDERKGLDVDEFMQVTGFNNIWGIGDCAANVDASGEPIPPNAQAAVQEGKLVARNILAAIDGQSLEAFEYKPVGQLVELGSEFAVNDVMGVKFSGFAAALFWRATYLYKLESPQSKVRISLDWILDLFLDPAVTQIRR